MTPFAPGKIKLENATEVRLADTCAQILTNTPVEERLAGERYVLSLSTGDCFKASTQGSTYTYVAAIRWSVLNLRFSISSSVAVEHCQIDDSQVFYVFVRLPTQKDITVDLSLDLESRPPFFERRISY